MAAVSGVVSYQIEDSDSEITSMDVSFTTASGLLADIISFINALTPAIDAVIDGKILKIRLTISVPLPGGLKSAVVSGAENERTGLFQMSVSGHSNTFGLDVPTWAGAAFSGNTVNPSATGVSAFEALLTATTNTTVITDRYGNPFTAIKNAYKTFRKHRKALRRA